ncbi:hypothetical protein HDU81_007895 [Chytriomyces hyalinus]|nr:hypothetical protein HDU81_007895 [Chytriomyces hyalinus]
MHAPPNAHEHGLTGCFYKKSFDFVKIVIASKLQENSQRKWNNDPPNVTLNGSGEDTFIESNIMVNVSVSTSGLARVEGMESMEDNGACMDEEAMVDDVAKVLVGEESDPLSAPALRVRQCEHWETGLLKEGGRERA